MLYMLKRIVRKIHVGYVCLMYGIRVYFYLKAKYQAFIIFMRGINCHHRSSVIFKNLTGIHGHVFLCVCQCGILLRIVISFNI